MIDNRLVGRKIAALRQSNALTQQQLAAMMNVSHQAVSKWESGQALPDIQTMLELTRFFGITVEQLISERTLEEEYVSASGRDTEEEQRDGANVEKEVNAMNIQLLMQMAPYMSKETVEEIVMEMEGRLTAAQIARIAPYVRPECVENLVEKHRPELTWDALRRIAPYMRRESVDELARAIASGKETVKSDSENFNKAMNDIGKAFDDIGKGVGQAVQKAIRFGNNMINEVASAISDLSNDAQASPVMHNRSERAQALRKKAFERAMADNKWDWIAEHMGELEGDTEFKARIATCAKEKGMHDWICKNMGGYADEFTIEAAISNGNWSWLGDNAWQLEDAMQQKVALAAMRAENWQWLGRYSDQLNLADCAMEIARTALSKGAKVLAAQIAENHLKPDQMDQLAREAYAAEDAEMLELLISSLSPECLEEILVDMAGKRDWERVKQHFDGASTAAVERLMELAVDQGNFEAVDALDRYL